MIGLLRRFAVWRMVEKTGFPSKNHFIAIRANLKVLARSANMTSSLGWVLKKSLWLNHRIKALGMKLLDDNEYKLIQN